jgi:hypothetical protein
MRIVLRNVINLLGCEWARAGTRFRYHADFLVAQAQILGLGLLEGVQRVVLHVLVIHVFLNLRNTDAPSVLDRK